MNLCTPPKPLSERHTGWTCAACQGLLHSGETVRECTRCGAPQHETCWDRVGACQAYECRQGADPRVPAEGAIKITSSDLKDVQVETLPVPPGLGSGAVNLARYVPRRTSRAAIVAFVLGLAALPFLGLPGIAAVVVGGVALASIYHDKSLKGALFAAAGMFLGLVAMVGWLLFAFLYKWNKEPADVVPQEFHGAVSLADAEPEVRAALERNVRIVRGNRMGAGIIVRSEATRFLILTNRHVVDAGFEDDPKSPGPKAGTGGIQVTFHSGVQTEATIDWTASHGVDLALLACRKEGLEIQPALIDASRPLRIGEEVYAIGNPEGFDWTYTRGFVSAFRTMMLGPVEVRLVQTQTPINPGNSGGGLYDKDGYLVGVNTLTASRGGSEGLNFAISIVSVEKVLESREGWK